jgi:hypothetical protein
MTTVYHILKKSTTFSLLAALLAIAPLGVMMYEAYIREYSVLVASSPATADIILDGNSIGKTPITLKLKKGSYTLGAKKMDTSL